MSSEMSRQEKALLCALAACEGLVEQGILSGGKWRLTEAGRADYARFKAEGFQATYEEIRTAMMMLQTETQPHAD